MNNKIFDFVYAMALRAATNRVKGSAKYNSILKNNAKNGHLKKILHNYIDNILLGKRVNFDYEVKAIDNELKKIGVVTFTFGQIQKLINITCKYFYIMTYDATYPSNAKRQYFKDCDCPLDKRMMNFVFDEIIKNKSQLTNQISQNNIFMKKTNKTKIHNTSWSQLKSRKGFYDDFQECVEALRKKGGLLNRLEYDYEHWQP